ncbi:MAG TPA: DUF4190 domain-containing protein [Chloroflexaceae bacterium]|nr:DUF4190 domain-containing protein [Chloroflexaceae bacterium]
MICAQCGATSEEGQRFCYNCGARLSERQPETATATAQPLPVPPPPAPIQPGAYQQPPAYAPQVIPNSPLAIASLVSGILAWVVLPFIGAIIAVVTGHMARNEISRSAGGLAGAGMALVGLILGYAQLAIIVLGACLFSFVFIAAVV